MSHPDMACSTVEDVSRRLTAAQSPTTITARHCASTGTQLAYLGSSGRPPTSAVCRLKAQFYFRPVYPLRCPAATRSPQPLRMSLLYSSITTNSSKHMRICIPIMACTAPLLGSPLTGPAHCGLHARGMWLRGCRRFFRPRFLPNCGMSSC